MITLVALVTAAWGGEPCPLSYTAGRVEGDAALAADAWRAGDEAAARTIGARAEAGAACVVDVLDARAAGALAALVALVHPEDPGWAATASDLSGLAWPWVPGEVLPAGPAWLDARVDPGAWRVDGAPAPSLRLSGDRGHVIQRVDDGRVETLLVAGPSPALAAALREREPLQRSRVDLTIADDGAVDARWIPSPARRPAVAAGAGLLAAGGALLGGHLAAAAAFERLEPRDEAQVRRAAALTDGLLVGAAVLGVAGVGSLGFGVWVDARGGLGVSGRW